MTLPQLIGTDLLPLRVRWLLDGIVFNGAADPVDGCEYLVLEESGWSGSPGVRTTRQPLPSAHGDYSGPQWLEGRPITLAGVVLAPTWEARRTAERRLAALCGDVAATYPLTCTEELGDVTAQVKLDGAVLVSIRPQGYSLNFSVQLYAPDPRKYLAEQSLATGLPLPGTGLDWEVGLAAATRTNLVRNTTGQGSPAWTAYNAGSTVAPIGLTDPPAGVDVRPWATRSTCTAPGSHGGSHLVTGITAGSYYTVSAYARPSATRDVRIYLEWHDAAGAVTGTTNFATTTGAAGGAWTRPSINRQPPAGAVSVLVSVVALSAAVGETLDATALLAEPAAGGDAPGTFFDGSSAGCSWRSAAYASPSVNAAFGLDWLAAATA